MIDNTSQNTENKPEMDTGKEKNVLNDVFNGQDYHVYGIPYKTEDGKEQILAIASVLNEQEYAAFVKEYMDKYQGTEFTGDIAKFIEESEGKCRIVELQYDYYIQIHNPQGELQDVRLVSTLPNEQFGAMLKEFFETAEEGKKSLYDLAEYSHGRITIPEDTLQLLQEFVNATEGMLSNNTSGLTEDEIKKYDTPSTATLENKTKPVEHFPTFFGALNAEEIDKNINKNQHT